MVTGAPLAVDVRAGQAAVDRFVRRDHRAAFVGFTLDGQRVMGGPEGIDMAVTGADVDAFFARQRPDEFVRDADFRAPQRFRFGRAGDGRVGVERRVFTFERFRTMADPDDPRAVGGAVRGDDRRAGAEFEPRRPRRRAQFRDAERADFVLEDFQRAVTGRLPRCGHVDVAAVARPGRQRSPDPVLELGLPQVGVFFSRPLFHPAEFVAVQEIDEALFADLDQEVGGAFGPEVGRGKRERRARAEVEVREVQFFAVPGGEEVLRFQGAVRFDLRPDHRVSEAWPSCGWFPGPFGGDQELPVLKRICPSWSEPMPPPPIHIAAPLCPVSVVAHIVLI